MPLKKEDKTFERKRLIVIGDVAVSPSRSVRYMKKHNKGNVV